MECPRCRLINPVDALRCDCGYDFESRTMQGSYALANLRVQHPDAAAWFRESGKRDIRIGSISLACAFVGFFTLYN